MYSVPPCLYLCITRLYIYEIHGHRPINYQEMVARRLYVGMLKNSTYSECRILCLHVTTVVYVLSNNVSCVVPSRIILFCVLAFPLWVPSRPLTCASLSILRGVERFFICGTWLLYLWDSGTMVNAWCASTDFV